MKPSPLLSICIPTYNRELKLRRSLTAWRNAINYYGQDDVELIVSDNCSTDNTPIILQEFECIPNLRHYRNEENIGFNKNMFLLVEKYAKGVFCWVIGDDDYVDKNCLSIIKNLLHDDIDYISLNFRKFLSQKAYENAELSNNGMIIKEKIPFGESIDMNSSLDNILATLMSTSVFRRYPFINCCKSGISDDSAFNYMSTFPNSYLMLTLFHSSKTNCVNSPLFSIVEEKKEWNNMSDLYFKKHLFQLYDYYCSILGKNQMENSKNGKWMRKLNAKYIVRDQLLKGVVNLKTIKALFLLLMTPQLYLNAIKSSCGRKFFHSLYF